MAGKKEKIYDAHISPLMDQIIAICKANKIAIVASFHLGKDLHCTTTLLEDSFNPSSSQVEACPILTGRSRSPLMINVRDGDGKIASSTAVL